VHDVRHVNTYATNSRKTKPYITEPNYQLTTSSNFYASLLLIVILITTRKPTNKSTVVLWEVLAVSPIVANLCMEEIEDTALKKSNMPPKK
jgi:hypothetical protein